MPDLDANTLNEAGNYALFFVGLAGSLAAAFGFASLVRGYYRRGVGRRRDLQRRVARLCCSVQLDYFAEILGAAPAMRRLTDVERVDYSQEPPTSKMESFEELFFVWPQCVVQAIVDPENSIAAYSVTARTKRFRPKLKAPVPGRSFPIKLRIGRDRYRPLLVARLNRTKFAAADSWEKENKDGDFRVCVKAGIGAHVAYYSERHSLGNPGYYQTYVLSVTTATRGADMHKEDLVALIKSSSTDDFDDGTASLSAPGRRFRRNAAITTYTVIGPTFSEEEYCWSFGPHGQEIRVIP